ncbi:conserved hypothetical protein, secreted [Candidatus Magnetomorum sp. HK-1]|nr:conserved hypothetical protein, secreted [Candidatus Magnetomorum sp. HK-1]
MIIIKLFIAMIVATLMTPYVYAEDLNSQLIRLDEKVEGLNLRIKETNQRIDKIDIKLDSMRNETNQRFDDINYRMLLFFLALIAVIMWDRRSSFNNVDNEIKNIKKRLDYIWNHFGLDKKTSIVIPD